MAIAARATKTTLKGSAEPRLAPPVPVRSMLPEFRAAASELGITLMPWQETAARYITALRVHRGRPRKDAAAEWAFREVAIVVARQNGKSELLIPRIVMGLRRGEHILHTAQNRDLPRKTFLRVAALIAADPDTVYVRKANGQEEIGTACGGRYKVVAPNSSSRGETADLVLIDEVREQHDQELMDAMLPTITARPNAQIIYLSNAGDDESLVLNDLRRRGTEEPDARLAYLEWSAGERRSLDDRDGWAEANPALGHILPIDTLEYFRANRPPASFETEHLCRWVVTMRPRLVGDVAWQRCRGAVGDPLRPAMAISMDASGTRASAAIAWQQSDGTVGLRVVAETHGTPIDVDLLGPELRQAALRLGATSIAFDPWDTADLARHFKNAKPLDGREFANASENFVRVIESGRLRWEEADSVTEDLAWTARKPHESGAWRAVKAKDDR
ncbi:MAG: hypothetical protein ACM3MJ_07080, partial [Deltaproteobacteria bacterium]